MKIYVEDVINYPQQEVYRIQRDEMSNLADHLPNIERIDVLEREELEGGVRIVNLWKAAKTEVPLVARKFIKPEMLSWKDYARWHDETFSCQWKLEMNFFSDQVKVSGKTTFEKLDDGRVRSVIDGELEVEVHKIPGVPKLLARKFRPEVEKFVIKLITPNLKGVNRGIEKYLDAQG
jgi:hypothetical protein